MCVSLYIYTQIYSSAHVGCAGSPVGLNSRPRENMVGVNVVLA